MKTLKLSGDQLPFCLDLTLACGQVFRWKKVDGSWIGVIHDQIVILNQENDKVYYDGILESELIRYFSLDISLKQMMENIRESISKYSGKDSDNFFEIAAMLGEGLRIIRQDPWEALMCFICSQNSNIPSITKRITLLCEQYGTPLGNRMYGFPKPSALASTHPDELRSCSTGYRASYLFETAARVLEKPETLKRIFQLSVKEARLELLSYPGVGPKVADCVLLFGYQFYEAVPVDVWIRTIITSAYPDIQIKTPRKKECSYDDIANFCRQYFGPNAGYAQQLLFAARQELPLQQNKN